MIFLYFNLFISRVPLVKKIYLQLEFLSFEVLSFYYLICFSILLGNSDTLTRSGNSDQDMVAEARLLRQHKGRLEARMQILEDHNRQLEAQLQRLRQLLDEVNKSLR